MKLKKLTPELVKGIIEAGFDQNPKEVQSLSIPKIKSGADIFIIAPEGAGKTTTIVLGVIQKLKAASGEAPRAIIMTDTKDNAFAIEALFDTLGKHTDLRTFTVFDHGIIQYQKDTIYEGLDVLIGTPKRINELLSTTGIPLSELKMLLVDNAETFYPSQTHPFVYRIGDAVEKAQFLIFANKWIENFELMDDRMMKNPLIIEVKE